MRHLRIFLLWFEDAFSYRSIAFVWFLVSLFNPLLYLLFWRGAVPATGEAWNMSAVSSYYLLFIVGGALLMAHSEETVAERDIYAGGLSHQMIRPYPYVLMRLMDDIPWRIVQGFFGVLSLIALLLVFSVRPVLSADPVVIVSAVLSAALAYLVSFFYKMILGSSAFWVTDYNGIKQVSDVVMLLLAGYVVPVPLLPKWASDIAFLTPFPYMVYVPVAAFQGSFTVPELLGMVARQAAWVAVLWLAYTIVWRKGLRLYTASEQTI